LAARHSGYSLADEYYLVLRDQRGSGLSMRHNKEVLKTDVFVADLHAVIGF